MREKDNFKMSLDKQCCFIFYWNSINHPSKKIRPSVNWNEIIFRLVDFFYFVSKKFFIITTKIM